MTLPPPLQVFPKKKTIGQNCVPVELVVFRVKVKPVVDLDPVAKHWNSIRNPEHEKYVGTWL